MSRLFKNGEMQGSEKIQGPRPASAHFHGSLSKSVLARRFPILKGDV
jgi:hypothetical protein